MADPTSALPPLHEPPPQHDPSPSNPRQQQLQQRAKPQPYIQFGGDTGKNGRNGLHGHSGNSDDCCCDQAVGRAQRLIKKVPPCTCELFSQYVYNDNLSINPLSDKGKSQFGDCYFCFLLTHFLQAFERRCPNKGRGGKKKENFGTGCLNKPGFLS